MKRGRCRIPVSADQKSARHAGAVLAAVGKNDGRLGPRHGAGPSNFPRARRRADGLQLRASLTYRPAMQPSDSILIVDFGSQVTQLIARRVREAGVYCEIAPFSAADEAFERLKPKGIILSGGPSSVMLGGQPARAAAFVRQRPADPRHLLRPAGDAPPAGRRSSAAVR